MKKKLFSFFVGGRRFKKEFKKQMRLLIIITLAFTIAFAWRQTIFDLSQSFIKFITNVNSLEASTILTSLFITILCLVFIYLSSYFLKDE